MPKAFHGVILQVDTPAKEESNLRPPKKTTNAYMIRTTFKELSRIIRSQNSTLDAFLHTQGRRTKDYVGWFTSVWTTPHQNSTGCPGKSFPLWSWQKDM